MAVPRKILGEMRGGGGGIRTGGGGVGGQYLGTRVRNVQNNSLELYEAFTALPPSSSSSVSASSSATNSNSNNRPNYPKEFYTRHIAGGKSYETLFAGMLDDVSWRSSERTWKGRFPPPPPPMARSIGGHRGGMRGGGGKL